MTYGSNDAIITVYHSFAQEVHMERVMNLHMKQLPEGVYLANSDAIQGLVAEGRTIQQTIEIGHAVAKQLFEAKQERV